jgi:hypothetical protein
MPQGTEGFVRKLLLVRPMLALDFAFSLEGPVLAPLNLPDT